MWVLIADDHAPTRAGVRAVLERHGFAVCAERADAPGAVAAALAERPDLCLLDVSMPGSGIAAAWEISARLPETRVVMLTVSADDRDLFPALRAGACGYLLKDMPAERIPLALREVMEGGAALPCELLARVLADFRERAPHRRRVHVSGSAEPLTTREWQVLDLLRRGAPTARIARELGVSRGTVRSHVMAVVRKLGVADRHEAARLFAEAG